MSTTQVRGDTTRTGLVIEHLERLTLSVNGNPRFRVHFTDGTVARTMSDASINHGLENPEYRGVPLAVTFTVHGNIRHAKPERYGVFYKEGEGPRYEDDSGNISFTWPEACQIAQQIDGGILKLRN